ncbi:hypothetical protein GW7_02977 [Heterocephalus glaber]|uniref:Uncharacterized protein n=1 Tax=Heterocephalus glaber TaxID=10181 RepID=G5B031_HETGA|nr:hypothetical protein GW7_02977 [Heterocephalus glaber]
MWERGSLLEVKDSSLALSLPGSREGEGDVDLCRLGDLERRLCGDLERLLLRYLSRDRDLSLSRRSLSWEVDRIAYVPSVGIGCGCNPLGVLLRLTSWLPLMRS